MHGVQTTHNNGHDVEGVGGAAGVDVQGPPAHSTGSTSV